jgi:putative transposase
MKKRQQTPEQIIRKLAEGEKLLGEGRSIGEVARHLEITESTWHRWRNQYGGMKADDAKELRELRKGEPAPQEDRRRPGPGPRHAEGAEPGKLLTPDRRRRAVHVIQERFGSLSAGPVRSSANPAPPNGS